MSPSTSAPPVVDADSQYTLDVITREQWGADESIRFDDDGKEQWREMFVGPRKLIIHHTATPNWLGTPDDAVTEVRSIYNYHTLVKGWGDIGYHALIDPFGNIYEGRHGRGGDPADGDSPREVMSASVVGGHTHNHEYGTIGVALIGDATEDGWPMPGPEGPMWDALVRYCAFECGRHALRPLSPGAFEAAADEPAISDFLRTDELWDDDVPNLGAHRHFEQTLCPGDAVIDLLPALRRSVHASLEGVSRTGVFSAPIDRGAREAAVGDGIGWSWTAEEPDSGWSLRGYEHRLEGWFKPDTSEDIDYIEGYTDDPQPRAVWNGRPLSATSFAFTPERSGQYTLHVRAIVERAGVLRRAAYQASQTYFVR